MMSRLTRQERTGNGCHHTHTARVLCTQENGWARHVRALASRFGQMVEDMKANGSKTGCMAKASLYNPLGKLSKAVGGMTAYMGSGHTSSLTFPSTQVNGNWMSNKVKAPRFGLTGRSTRANMCRA